MLEDFDAGGRFAFRILLGSIVVGLLAVAAFSFDPNDFSSGLSVFAIGVLLAGAALFVGSLLGFLFGIPRSQPDARAGAAGRTNSISSGPDAGAAVANAAAASVEHERARYRPNTNLEEISDWLTKILVGVGLTALAVFPERMGTMASYLAVGLGGRERSEVFALAMLIFFLVSGFLVSYLWTRTILPGWFSRAESEMMEPVRRGLDRIEKLVKALRTGLQREDYLSELARIREKERSEGRCLSLIYADVDGLKRKLQGVSTATLAKAEVLDVLERALQEAAAGEKAKFDVFSLAIGDPDRILILRTDQRQSGPMIAEVARRRFAQSTAGRGEFGLKRKEKLTVSCGVLWYGGDGGSERDAHDQALEKLHAAKEAGKDRIVEAVFAPRQPPLS